MLVQGTIPAPSPCNRLPQDAENAHPLGGAATSQPGSRNFSQNQLIWQFTDQRGLSPLLGIHVALYGEATPSRVCERDGCGLECGGLDTASRWA